MTARERILMADKKRRRTADFELDGIAVPVTVAVYSMAEFREKVDKFSSAGDEENAEFLSAQFFDPETGERLFSREDVLEMSVATTVALLRFFSSVNNGALEKKI